MSEAGGPPRAVGEEQVIPDSEQPSTSSARMEQEPPPPSPPFLGTGNTGSPDSEASCLEVDIMSALGEEHEIPASPPPATSPAAQQDTQQVLEVGDDETSDSVSSSVDSEIMSISASAARSRLWSPPAPSSGSSARERAKRQIKIQPFVTAGGGMVKWPGQARGVAQNFRWANRPMQRSYSPQPSTSTGLPRDLQPFFDPYDLSVEHMYAEDLSMRRGPAGSCHDETSQPSTSTVIIDLVSDAEDDKPPDSTGSDDSPTTPAQEMSPPSGGTGSRPWSPQPTTPPDDDDPMAAQQYIDYSEVGRDFSIPKTKTVWTGAKMLPPKKVTEASSTDARNNSPPPLRRMLRRWPSQQLITPADRVQMQMQTRMETAMDMSYAAVQNLSMPAGEEREGKKRPWSPQPSTSTAEIEEHKGHPLIEAIESNEDAFSLSLVKEICALVEEKRKRMRSPQPGPSSAPDQYIEEGEILSDVDSPSVAENVSIPFEEEPEPTNLTTARVEAEQPPVEDTSSQDPPDSVYAHVPHDISNIPQLRGLKAGRRHGRLRRLYTQNKVTEKYGPIVQYIGPMVAEERAKQQLQEVVIDSALNYFAYQINQIADMCEGKTDTTGFNETLEEFKKQIAERRARKCKRDLNAAEEPVPEPSTSRELSDEEIVRRLREEVEVAVEALTTGDRSKEFPPSRLADIIKSFQDAFNPQ